MRSRIVVLAAVVTAAVGCSSLDVQSDWDREVDFSQYSSYAWLEPETEDGAAPMRLPEHLEIRLRRVVGDILEDKGFEPAFVPPTADVYLVYYLDVHKEMRVDMVAHEYYGGYGYGAWGPWGPVGGVGATTARVREYDTGTLVLDIIDRERNMLVWTGSVEGTARSNNPSGDRVEQVMTEMLKDFPPRR